MPERCCGSAAETWRTSPARCAGSLGGVLGSGGVSGGGVD